MCSHDRQVVGDEQVGQAELLLQILEQVDDLRLDRNVERRDRLVADDQLRRHRERASDADAAGAGRRRTRADSGACDRRCSPTLSSSSTTRSSNSRRIFASLWMINASPMIAPTVMRGSSEAIRVLEDDLHVAAAARAARCRTMP